tara:strand:- start:30025 stop:30969 length:945 start_codon:yes stop_codon:yes gene_type:complete
MKYELTIFKSIYDNQTHRKLEVESWSKFKHLLRGLSAKKGSKHGKCASPLITPAVFQSGSRRTNASTIHWGGWCAVDVDDHSFPNPIEELKVILIQEFNDLDFVCYSTASSRDDKVKFRLVFRLDEPVENTRIKSFWYAFNTHLGEIGDPQTKDLARMYFVPAQYPDANNFIFEHDGGSPVNVSEMIAKYPYVQKTGNSFLDRLPPEMQQVVIDYRKNSLNNTDIHWTSYRDCPFFPKRMGIEYQTISETGWYGKMYAIMIAIAGGAIKKGYPITAAQISELCKEFDSSTGNWYENRPLTVEADRAIEYVFRKG